MAHLNPAEAFEVLKDRTSKTVSGYFPIEGKKHLLRAKSVWVDDNLARSDLRSQKEAKLKGRSWAVPVRAKLELVDKATGKVKDTQEVTLAQIPKITNRYSYIVGGNEYQVNNQFRLKSGAYTRVRANGELTTQWNLAKGLGFDVNFDPRTKKMTMKHLGKGSNIALYPVLKSLGVDDDAMERQWGREIFTANKKENEEAALKKYYKTFKGVNPPSTEAARQLVVEEMDRTELRPDSAKLTLGKPFTKVTGSALMAGAGKLLRVARQEEKPDDRDALQFKDLYSAEDLVVERLERGNARSTITRKIANTLDKRTKVREIMNPDFFGRPIKAFFTSSTLSERPDQTNPASFLVGNRRTTLMGEGGISSELQLTKEAKSINPSHMGFLDPIQTPESERTGVALQLAMAARKEGHDLTTLVHDVKKGRDVRVTPLQALGANVAFPDQYRWQGKKAVPIGSTVKVADNNGEVRAVKPGEVDYVLKSAKGLFDVGANMIPFLQNDQGNRTMMGVKQIEQAIGLVRREAPLVQTLGEGGQTTENMLGRFVSQRTGVGGTVSRITKEAVYVKDEKGKEHEAQIYNNFPLNDDKSKLHSEPVVKVGDKVKAGQLVADSNFTKNEDLALGTNLQVAYMPYKGYNFEDGIVISESAAQKLTSDHMFRQGVSAEKNVVLNKKKFLAETAGAVTKEQADKLDDFGVIKSGAVVNQGDVLIGMMRKQEVTPEQKKLGMFSKSFLRPVKPQEVRWEKETPGVVARVVKHGKNTTVYVNSQAPATIGDKIVGRHGNKGIITHILPDHEMPKTKDGEVAQVLLNPVGIPSRINVGQVLETAAAKIARKTGRPYKVNNFDPDNRDYTRNLMKELKAHGVSDTEEMIDPSTSKSYGKVLFGPQYILKLHHTAAKGLSSRSRHSYDSNMVPQRGGPRGGQTMDAMGMYALLAHNARENIREMQTYRSDYNDQFWEMIQAGDSPPAPKVPFVFKKFEGYLKGMGVDMVKEGNDIILQPLTDKKVLEMSNGEVKHPERQLRGKDLKPEAGGIFDPKVTGTSGISNGLGTKWSHIKLSERMPNPVFETSIASLLGVNKKNIGGVVGGKEELEGMTGPAAITAALRKVDVNKEAEKLKAALPTMRTSELNKANRKMKYLRALQKSGMTPVDAYTMKHMPVLPPTMRPVSIRDSGDLIYDDINKTYANIGKINYQLNTMDPSMPPEEKNDLHESMYDGIRGLALTGVESQGKHLNGIAEILAGKTSPKEGFFQQKIIGRRQDLSMRGTIVPEPSLSLDEVAIPRKAAAEVYKPFVVANLVNRRGYSPLMAQQKVKEDGVEARSALEEVAAERPLLLKRDPVLHKYGVQAFRPRLVTGQAIKIHPLATTGYNADFDGDKMSAYVPVSQKAVKEAWKMMPSNNIFSPSTGYVMFKPTQDSMQGLFNLTEMGKNTSRTFDSAADAARAVKEGKIGLDDVITVKGLGGVADLSKLAAATRTTVGRMMVYGALPEKLRTDSVLSDKNFVLNKGGLQNLLTDIATTDKGNFGVVSDKLKDLGNARATGLSIGLADFLSDYKDRDEIMAKAGKEENKVRADKRTSPAKRDEKIVNIYIEAGKKIDAKTKARANANPNRMYDWIRSGAKGSWDNYKQMTVTPLLVADTDGKPIPVPIDRSYSEGLDIGSYWASMYGARMGTISRAEGTWRPGLMSKQMMSSTMNQMVVSDDCGTKKGMSLPLEERDILGRFTSNDIKITKKGKTEVIPAGTVVDPDVVNRLKNNRVTEVPVRTPLRCLHGKGMCAKCYGLDENGQLHPQGVNVGVIAAQALGEPATQLSMNSFHTGGVVGAKGTAAQGTFERVNQLLQVPKILPGAATLAKADGKVDEINKDPAGGWSVFVSGQRHYVPPTRDLTVKKRQQVKKGESISTGVKNPREMLPLTGMPTVQRYITDELHGIYKGVAPVKRRNTETFVRAMTNLSKVTDAGDHESLLPGDTVPATEVYKYNSQRQEGTKPVRTEPLLHGVSVLPLEVQTDWLARMQATNLRSTILDAASERWSSAVHSTHPIPGMAYGAEFGKGTPEEPWLY